MQTKNLFLFFVPFLVVFFSQTVFAQNNVDRLERIDRIINGTNTQPTNFESSSTATTSTSSSTSSLNESENIYRSPLSPELDQSQLETNDSGVPIVSSEQVGNDDELDALVFNLKLMNPNIENILVNTSMGGDTTFQVEYKHPGTFLGILPVNYKSIETISTTNTGMPTITSELSFWSSIVSDKKHDRSSIVSQIIQNPLILTEAQPNSTPLAKARVIEAYVYELNRSENTSI